MLSRIPRRFIAAAVVVCLTLTPVLGIAASPWLGDRTDAVRNGVQGGVARNVILLIGDGLGDSEITIARNYAVGAAGRLALDSMPMTGAMTHYSVQESDPSTPDYDPESASTASAWSTGVKTADGRISTAAATDQDLTTILDLARRATMRTGLVSTAEITDATPAAPAAHVNSRGCQGPANMGACPQDKKSAGGPGSIAEQQIDHQVNVILGGGRARYEQTIDGGPDLGKTVARAAQDKGYTYVADAAQLTDLPLRRNGLTLGLFATGNMALEWSGALAQPYPGSGPQRCAENQRPADQPSLAAMTRKAIELLDYQAWGQPGFFLQVEGASIDKQDHAVNPCGQIGETVAFDAAVKVALDYAARQRDTLVIITADHAHTSQIIERPTSAAQPGAFSTLITNEGAEMTVLYATAPVGSSQQHTGAQVRVGAQGPQAANVVGVIDNTELFRIMARALRLATP